MLATTEAYGLTFQFPPGDDAVGASLRDYGEFARPELDFLLAHATGESGALLDIGANIGAIGLPFAACRSNWQVVAVEASNTLAPILAHNATRNGLENVSVLHAAAGERTGTAAFPHVNVGAKGNFGNLGFSYPATEYREVPMVTLDSIAPADTRLIKIDVQGFEPAVLRGAVHLRRTVRPMWIVEVSREWQAASEEVISILQADGYSLYWFFSPFATPISPKAQPEDPFKGDISVVAMPAQAPNSWELTPLIAATQRPVHISAYRYLERYARSRT